MRFPTSHIGPVPPVAGPLEFTLEARTSRASSSPGSTLLEPAS
jgi:hypothetical protein